MGRTASPHSGMSGAEMGSGHAGSSIRIDNQKHDQPLGSCNFRNGKLSFALDLAAKPEDLIESVVIHELTHLLEPSHNQRFQQLMASWDKEYRSKRKRLNHFPREFYG